ncbi:MAG: DUF819 family protein [Bacteroidota bacterium]
MNDLLTNPLFILIVISFNIAVSIWLENNTPLKTLGAALLVILITAVIANLGIIPSATAGSEVYSVIFSYIAPISIFYLLLGVSLKHLKAAGLPMLTAFGLGTLGTVLGVLFAYMLLGHELGDNAKVIAGMIAGTYIGGSINFNAIAIEYDMMQQGPLYVSITAVDNILTTLWMMTTIAIPWVMNRWLPTKPGVRIKEALYTDFDSSGLNISSLGILIFIGLLTLLISDLLAEWLGIPSILILTTIALILAQIPYFNKLQEAKVLGLYMVYAFLAVIGAYCELSAMAGIGQLAITVLGFLTIVVLIHGAMILLTGILFKTNWSIIAVASQANIGGSSSALALAKSLKRNDLLLPAVLVGSLGNGIGTYIGFLLIKVL